MSRLDEDHADAACSGAAESQSTALTRSLHHLDVTRWLIAVALSAAVRTSLQHPLSVAVARKRVHTDTVSLRHVLATTAAEGRAAAAGRSAMAQRTAALRALYRGCGVAIVGNIIGECVYLFSLEATREYFPSSLAVVRDGAGGIAGDSLSLLAVTPLSVVCNRQMTAGFGLSHGNRYEPAAATARSVMARNGGWRGLYAGMSASVYVLPSSALWWSSYGVFKGWLYSTVAPRLPAPPPSLGTHTCTISHAALSRTDNAFLNGSAGVLSSVLVTTVSNPLAVVRTRLQVMNADSAEASAAAGQPRARGPRVVRVAREVVRQEGWHALFKGLRVNAAVAALDGLMFSGIYEFTKWLSDVTLPPA